MHPSRHRLILLAATTAAAVVAAGAGIVATVSRPGGDGRLPRRLPA